jgi:3-deoxy-D-manno-octulosonic-acid transferase
MRAIYTLLWYLALPLLPLRLLWRGRREPGYREHIGERFGRYRGAVAQPLLWVHAVSLGETRAVAPLVDRMRRAHPGATVLLTHMTATGRASGRALFGDSVVQAWLPYDVPYAVRAFLAHFRPRAGLIMETELWPNLVALAHAAEVPLYLVNARMSARSAR